MGFKKWNFCDFSCHGVVLNTHASQCLSPMSSSTAKTAATVVFAFFVAAVTNDIATNSDNGDIIVNKFHLLSCECERGKLQHELFLIVNNNTRIMGFRKLFTFIAATMQICIAWEQDRVCVWEEPQHSSLFGKIGRARFLGFLWLCGSSSRPISTPWRYLEAVAR